jgi:hypothetical protein
MHVVPSAFLALALAALWHPADPDPGTWILQLGGDATKLTVVGGSHKQFPFRAPRGKYSDFSIRLFDANGAELRAVPLDLSTFCMDPSHVGDPPHVDGDVVREHAVSLNVKVPALADVARIVFERRAKEPATEPTRLGEIAREKVVELTKQEVR